MDAWEGLGSRGVGPGSRGDGLGSRGVGPESRGGGARVR